MKKILTVTIFMKLLPIGFKKLSNQDFSLAKTFLIIDISLYSCMVKRF